MNSPLPRPEPRSPAERLADLGLTLEVFDTAAREHLAAYFACTRHHPPTFPPTAAWAEGNRSVRDQLVPRWTAKNERNQPLVINDDKTLAITALSGDEKTGTDETPSTRSPKGRATAEAVQINNERAQSQFPFMEDAVAVMEASKEPGRTLWIFLVHRDLKNRELRSELSRPLEMSEDGYIDKWGDRIIFPAIPFDFGDADFNQDNPNSGNEDGGQSPEITVEVRKL
jgi:hypothetical protein